MRSSIFGTKVIIQKPISIPKWNSSKLSKQRNPCVSIIFYTITARLQRGTLQFRENTTASSDYPKSFFLLTWGSLVALYTRRVPRSKTESFLSYNMHCHKILNKWY